MSYEWNDATNADSASYTRLSTKLEQQKQLLDTWRIALRFIANGDDGGRWGRIALEALDKEQKP